MGDILSQSELNSLLAALTTAADQNQVSAAAGNIPAYRTLPPQSGSQDDGSITEAAHEVARRIGSNWSHFLQQRVEVSVDSAGRLDRTTARGSDSLTESDDCGSSHPWIALHWIETDLDALIRSFEGGQACGPSISRRELTRWDRQLIERITSLTIGILVEGLWPDGPTGPSRNLRRADEGRVRMRFACDCPAGIVRMEIFLSDSLCANLAGASAAIPAQTGTRTSREQLEARAILAEISLTRQQLLSLSVGDLLLTAKSQTSPVQVRFGRQSGLPDWTGSPGVHLDRKAVRLESAISCDDHSAPNRSQPTEERGPG